MKKRSFFERLAGSLRFEDSEEQEITEKRQLTVNDNSDKEIEKTTTPFVHQEEVGELPVDVYETPNEIIIQTLIAGVLPEHLSINISRDTVTVSGKREENKSIPDENYYIRELYWGAFERVVDLPAEVEIDSSEAIERHGMLMIKLPKIDKKRKTVLKIKSI